MKIGRVKAAKALVRGLANLALQRVIPVSDDTLIRSLRELIADWLARARAAGQFAVEGQIDDPAHQRALEEADTLTLCAADVAAVLDRPAPPPQDAVQEDEDGDDSRVTQTRDLLKVRRDESTRMAALSEVPPSVHRLAAEIRHLDRVQRDGSSVVFWSDIEPLLDAFADSRPAPPPEERCNCGHAESHHSGGQARRCWNYDCACLQFAASRPAPELGAQNKGESA